MRDIKTIKKDNLKRLEMSILAEVASLEKDSDLARLFKLAHNYRKQIGVIRGDTSNTACTISGVTTHTGVF